MSLQFAVQDKENLISNGPLKQVQKQQAKAPLQKAKSGLQQRSALKDVTNVTKTTQTAVLVPVKVKTVAPAVQLKHTEAREYAHYSTPVSFADPAVEEVDFNQIRSMRDIFDKKAPSLSALDDMPLELDQEPLGIDEELPSEELHFNLGFDALAPLELELTF